MEVKVEDIFAQYDPLAAEIIGCDCPNTDVSLSHSNRDLAESICQAMGWEDFDLFEKHDFEEAEKSTDPAVCLSYAFLSFLRWRLFTEAEHRGIGISGFNIKATAYSEYWYVKLVHRWNDLRGGGGEMKSWLM